MGLLDDPNSMALIQAGLSMLANNNNKHNPFPAIGAGGMVGLQTLMQMKEQQKRDAERKAEQDMKLSQFDMQKQMFDSKMAHEANFNTAINGLPGAMAETFKGPYANPDQAVQMANPALAQKYLATISPETFVKNATKKLYPNLDNQEYGMSPRIGTNKLGKPEYVQFGKNGLPLWTGIEPTKDQLEIQKLIDAGVLPEDYVGGVRPQPQQNNAPQSVSAPSNGLPTNNFTTPYSLTWSGPTATDIKEGTSPNMELKPILSPKGRRGVNEAVAKESALAPIKTAQAAAEAGAKLQAESQAKTQTDLPQAQYNAESTIKLVDDLLAHPGFKGAVGFSSYNPLNKVAGTDANDFNIMLDQLKGKQFMEAYQTLKGGGQITEVEGKKATDAISRMNTASSEKAFIKAARDFQDAVRAGYEKLQQRAGITPAGSNSARSKADILKQYGVR